MYQAVNDDCRPPDLLGPKLACSAGTVPSRLIEEAWCSGREAIFHRLSAFLFPFRRG